MSERQLVLALAAGGREVALTDLTTWRHDGLLPVLASTGVHNGRTYYWREPDILEQAQTVFDELRRHGRTDATMVSLWLAGFKVPLPRLRRAWLYGHKLGRPAAIQPTSRPLTRTPPDLAGLLHKAVLGAAAAIKPEETDRAGLAMLEHAAAYFGLKRAMTGDLRQAWHMAQVALFLLSSSDLVRKASDETMLRAQRALRVALDFIWQSGAAETRIAVVIALGRPLFLYFLTLLASGQDEQLDAALARLSNARRPQPIQQPVYAQA